MASKIIFIILFSPCFNFYISRNKTQPFETNLEVQLRYIRCSPPLPIKYKTPNFTPETFSKIYGQCIMWDQLWLSVFPFSMDHSKRLPKIHLHFHKLYEYFLIFHNLDFYILPFTPSSTSHDQSIPHTDSLSCCSVRLTNLFKTTKFVLHLASLFFTVFPNSYHQRVLHWREPVRHQFCPLIIILFHFKIAMHVLTVKVQIGCWATVHNTVKSKKHRDVLIVWALSCCLPASVATEIH